MDLPAPVSPVSTLKPGVKFTSAFSITATFSIFSLPAWGSSSLSLKLPAAGVLLQLLADGGCVILAAHQDKERVIAGKRADDIVPLLGVEHLARSVGHAGKTLDQYHVPA